MLSYSIGVERTREFVREMARFYDFPFLEYKTPEDYDKIVSEHGFPGGAAHRFMYTLLKERPLRQVMRDHTSEMRPPGRNERTKELRREAKALFRDREFLDTMPSVGSSALSVLNSTIKIGDSC